MKGDPNEPRQRIELTRTGEARRNQFGQRSRKDHGNYDAEATCGADEIGRGTKRLPRALVSIALEMLEKNWNEDDRQRSGCQEIVQKIRQREKLDWNPSRAVARRFRSFAAQTT